jgi:hypothetical protein
LRHRLTAWSARKSDNGFDMIAMADVNCECYFVEAFFLNPKDRFLRTEDCIVAISLLENEATAAMIVESGTLLFAQVNP